MSETSGNNESIIALALQQKREEEQREEEMRQQQPQFTPARASQIVKDKLGLDIPESSWIKKPRKTLDIEWYEYETKPNSISPRGSVLCVAGEENFSKDRVIFQFPKSAITVEADKLSDIAYYARKLNLRT